MRLGVYSCILKVESLSGCCAIILCSLNTDTLYNWVEALNCCASLFSSVDYESLS